MGPLVRRVPFLKSMPPPDLLFPKAPMPNPFPQSLLSLFVASSGYISRARTPFRLHPTLSRCQRSSRDATASLELYHTTAVCHPKLYAIFGPSPSQFPTLVSSPCSPLHPGTFYSLISALNREIAISGNGAAAERHRFPVPTGAPPLTVPRLDLIRPF
jgi:hypothetical protein